ncbi:MAG: peptide deformylase [Clostridia bacterium]|nr:peptide deformylase [Clostridia bacterium]
MIKNIVRDTMFLALPSQEAQISDSGVAKDLEDTLKANADRCVGLAANMIGARKRVIAVSLGFTVLIMYNPVIVAKSGPYDTEEGCLSLSGERPVRRYENITVEYRDRNFRKQKGDFSGYIAQIIQHETDHCNGILI